MDAADLDLLASTLRAAMTGPTGEDLYAALVDLGWHEMLSEAADSTVPLVFRLLGETGAHAPLLDDVIRAQGSYQLQHADPAVDEGGGEPTGATGPLALPYAGGRWVRWEQTTPKDDSELLDPDLPLREVSTGGAVPLAAGRVAVGWWLTGASRAMLTLARTHALDRVQFGRPIASFQAVRHRLAEAFVAVEGAEATLTAATGDLGSALAKAAAGRAALVTARHCQQTLGGIGFTAEHALHRHIRRVLVLDGLLGSSRELLREAGATIRVAGTAPRLVGL
ncbi:acyl-CoA dehydrogenase family protein [Nocardia rosealba]|uniref:acyl-CoA dehydrogenase family protein n=1 Tax=Nocardia rosealba TaxID=2878563 RepID=UPI001CD96D5D|nr:acyl-CoA dehydrogenase family protein [Nocardia rosealba]MCA2207810.1 acyl-CoA dehydrogenase [Nocardia rosealba]